MEKKFKFIDLFAGIGGIRTPFAELGGECVFSSEWDKYAQSMYLENYGEMPKGDITQIGIEEIPEHDVLLGGFPCQAFSIMGNQQGFTDTRGTLFFEIERILRAKKPKAFLLENVKQLAKHDKGRTLQVILTKLKELGYKVDCKVLNAMDFGLPQKRERIMIVGFLDNNIEFEFPVGNPNNCLSLEDILEKDEDVDKKYWASEQIRQNRKKSVEGKNVFYPSIWHENKSGNISINSHCCTLRAGSSHNYLLVNGVRRFTPRELLRFQGFPEDIKIVVSDAQIKKQAGNSVAVPVIRAVAKKMIEHL